MVVVAGASRLTQLATPQYAFTFYNGAALTAGGNKVEFFVPWHCRIVDVIAYCETIGSGGTSNILDVNKNGTTIYTTQANRPTNLLANTGLFTEAGEPEIKDLAPGDRLSVDVDQVTTTGCARVTIVILVAIGG